MLIDVHDIHPMTEFNKKNVEYVERLRQTRKPDLLTVNGTASIVIQDADAYPSIIERLDLLESVVRVRQAIQKGRPPYSPTTAYEIRGSNGNRRIRRFRIKSSSSAATVSPGKTASFSSSKTMTPPRGIRGRKASSASFVGV
jgi:PHD/YefM family antitoxin component YafN of YafNO toxin-antitoxin module